MSNKTKILGALVIGVAIGLTSLVMAYSGGSPKMVVEGDFTGDYVEATTPVDETSLGGLYHPQREIFDEGIELKNGTKIGSYYFDTDVASFADNTTTLCALYNDDPNGKDRWVTSPFAAITGPATTTVTFAYATSSTPYKTNASTAVVSMKVATGTETAVGLPSYNSNTGIASGVFKWANGEYLLFTASAENSTLEKAITEPGINTLDGRCVVDYMKE